MEWWLTPLLAAEPPASDGSSESLTTALIAVLGTVLVALITVGLPLLFRQARTSESPPVPAAPVDTRMAERLAVAERLVNDDRTILDVIDRRLDRAEDDIERLKWQVGRLTPPDTDSPPPRL